MASQEVQTLHSDPSLHDVKDTQRKPVRAKYWWLKKAFGIVSQVTPSQALVDGDMATQKPKPKAKPKPTRPSIRDQDPSLDPRYFQMGARPGLL